MSPDARTVFTLCARTDKHALKRRADHGLWPVAVSRKPQCQRTQRNYSHKTQKSISLIVTEHSSTLKYSTQGNKGLQDGSMRGQRKKSPHQASNNYMIFWINNRRENSSHDGWRGAWTTADYGLLYRQPLGRGNPPLVFLWAAAALGRVCSSECGT